MEALLARQGIAPEEVPELGRRVLLSTTSNLKSGGTPVDVTDHVHPENRRLAVIAAAVTRVDIAGIDFITPDISRPWLEAGGAVVEVNTSPNHFEFAGNERHGVAEAIIEHIVPTGQDARMPLVAVIAGDSGRADHLARAVVDHLAQRHGQVVWSDGRRLFLGNDLLRREGRQPLDGAAAVLAHPLADAGVLALTAQDIIAWGLPWPDCDVAVLDGEQAGAPERLAMAAVARAARHGVVTIGEGHLSGAAVGPAAANQRQVIGENELDATLADLLAGAS